MSPFPFGSLPQPTNRTAPYVDLTPYQTQLVNVTQDWLTPRRRSDRLTSPASGPSLAAWVAKKGFLIPYEAYEVVCHVSLFKVGALLLNVAVVGYLAYRKRLFVGI